MERYGENMNRVRVRNKEVNDMKRGDHERMKSQDIAFLAFPLSPDIFHLLGT